MVSSGLWALVLCSFAVDSKAQIWSRMRPSDWFLQAIQKILRTIKFFFFFFRNVWEGGDKSTGSSPKDCRINLGGR